MKLSGVSYSITEGIADLVRNKMVSLLSIITIAVSITVFGLFILLAFNVDALNKEDQDNFLIHIFLEDDGSAATDFPELVKQFEQDKRIISYLFVTSADAQKRFEELFPEEAELGSQLEDFRLPASFDVEVDPELVENDTDLQQIATDYANIASVDEILYDSKWQEALKSLTSWITGSGLFLGGLLIFAAIVTTSNIIKINYLSRKDEIEIMRLVGADSIYIKGPFLFSGLLQGFLASVLSLIVLYLVFVSGATFLENADISILANARFQFLSIPLMLLLVGGGTITGFLASFLTLVSVNKV